MRSLVTILCLTLLAAAAGLAADETAVIDPVAIAGIRISVDVDPHDPSRVACSVEWTRGSDDARVALHGDVEVLSSTAPESRLGIPDGWSTESFAVQPDDRTTFTLIVRSVSPGRPVVILAERADGDVVYQASVGLELDASRTPVARQRNLRLRHHTSGDGTGAVIIDHLGTAPAKAQIFADDGTNRNIPDGPTDCSSGSTVWPLTTFISVSSAPPSAVATAVQVRLMVTHPRMADLQIVFSKEFYTVARYLWNRGSGTNLDQVFTTDIYSNTLPGVGEQVNGSWVLALRDCDALDIGYLDYWSVRIDYAGGATIDLVADSVSVSPTTVAAGGQVEVDWAGHVAGSGTVSGPFGVGFYLSNDTTITTGDAYLGLETVSTAINPGDSFGQSSPGTTVTIPSGTADGSYYLGMIIDPSLAIGESNEGNNTAFASLTVGSGGGGSCQYGMSTLYLQNGRFRVTGGAFLQGMPTDFFLQNLCPNGDPSETSAAFYFNAAWPPVQEGFVSIRNGCSGPRNAYIVEVACASTRKFYLDVTDTWTSTTQRYENPTGGSSVCFPADATSFAGSCP